MANADELVPKTLIPQENIHIEQLKADLLVALCSWLADPHDKISRLANQTLQP